MVLPIQAQANFFSSLLGDSAYADKENVVNIDPSQNSQTVALLEANVSSVSSSVNTDKSADGQVDQNSNVNISENALLPQVSPLGASDIYLDSSNDQTSVYVVRKGDSIKAIADMFGVSVNTILAANDMRKGDPLTVDQVLVILPISGIEHTVVAKETLAGIAKKYNADISDIISYNDINPDEQLAVGDVLLIPNAENTESDKPIVDIKASVTKDNQYYQKHPTKTYNGYYIDPVPGYRLSQGIHDNNAVDLAIGKGTPIHAAASGVALVAKTGCVVGAKRCGGGFGNYVVLNHPNGTQTLYAHQTKVIIHAGQQVTQGQVIGYVGSTGHSTGAHLHFEVHGARNPGADGSWAN